ncbi:hypothetical protein EMCRGX_G019384 [Ephydatia muelleri]|eukprot:Em0011g645a
MPESGSLPDGWERAEAENGIPYYINHHTEKVQWDHPHISEVLRDTDGLNDIRYAAYRTAMKLRAMQKATQMNMVQMSIVKQAFIDMGLGETQNSSTLSVVELESLIAKIYCLAHHQTTTLNPNESANVSISWLLKCLDSGRSGSVNVRALKVVLAAMCSAPLEDKYRYMFLQAAGGQVGLEHRSCTQLLEDLILIPKHLMEGATFHSGDLESATNSCWSSAHIEPDEALNRDLFLSWVLQEPRCIVWLPTMHRIASAETVRHDAKCSVCKIFPIIGLRYRCLKCSNVDICQSCFWTQRTLKNHKVTHPTKEYCLETTTGDDVRDFYQQVKNKITRRYRHKAPKKVYLDYPHADEKFKRMPECSLVFRDVHNCIDTLAARLREIEVTDDQNGSTSTPHPVPAPRKIKSPESRQIVAEIESHEDPPVNTSKGALSPRTPAGLAASAAEKRLMEERLKTLEQQNAKLRADLSRANAAAAAAQSSDSLSQSSHHISSVGVNTLRQEESIKMGEERESLEEMIDSLMDLGQTETEDPDYPQSDLLAAAAHVGRIMATIVDAVEATQEQLT